MGVLKAIGVVLIVAWLVLWLFVKITFAAIHLLFLIGIAMLLFGFLKRGRSQQPRSSVALRRSRRRCAPHPRSGSPGSSAAARPWHPVRAG